MQVWYVELKGPEATRILERWLEQLPGQAGFQGAELLVSPAQPGLALIASRWESAAPRMGVPEEAKHWTFEVVARR